MLIVLLAALAPLLALVAVGAYLRAASLGRERTALLQQVRRAQAQRQWAEEDALAVLSEATQLEDALAKADARIACLQKHLQRRKSNRPFKPALPRCVVHRAPLPFKISRLSDLPPATGNAHPNAHLN